MKKLFITLFIAAIAIYLFGDGNDSHQSNKGGSATKASQNDATISAQPQEENMQSKIESICRKNISNGDELIKVEVNEDMSNKNYGSGKVIVLPYFKSQSGARSTELMKISKMMKILYSEGLPISEVTIFTQDMSGKTIMKSTLSAEKAATIDWENVRYSNFDKQLDKFWTVSGLRN
jgi:hypothetical protein